MHNEQKSYPRSSWIKNATIAQMNDDDLPWASASTCSPQVPSCPPTTHSAWQGTDTIATWHRATIKASRHSGCRSHHTWLHRQRQKGENEILIYYTRAFDTAETKVDTTYEYQKICLICFCIWFGCVPNQNHKSVQETSLLNWGGRRWNWIEKFISHGHTINNIWSQDIVNYEYVVLNSSKQTYPTLFIIIRCMLI